MGRHKGFAVPAVNIWGKIIVPHLEAWDGAIRGIEMNLHSRGGAIGIGMLEYIVDPSIDYSWRQNVHGLTFGAPRYGTDEWAKRMTLHKNKIIRVENKFDPVPKLPTERRGYTKLMPVLKIHQPWPWAMLPIRSHVWYNITINSCLTKKAIDKFNTK